MAENSKDKSISNDIGKTIDSVAKSVTVLAVAVYGCGYLVSSIYQYEYGFIDVSPLRPKIISAGIWYLFFIALPFFLHFKAKGIAENPGKFQKWMSRIDGYVLFYAAHSWWLGILLTIAFEASKETVSPNWFFSGWISVPVFIMAALSFFFGFYGMLPRSVEKIIAIAFFGYLISWGARDAIIYHRASGAAITLWILAIGWAELKELNSRYWSWKLGDWIQTFTLGLATLVTFSTFYYPKMKSSWGGGAPIPVTIVFTKDSGIGVNQRVPTQLIEQNDLGYYLIGQDDKKATFIPRSEVGMVYYSDDASGFFLSKPK